MAGTPKTDVLCALQANDYQSGAQQADRLFGDNGRDTMVGGKGADILKAGKGNDRLFAVDGKPDDILVGQNGEDSCFGDVGDVMKGCEHRFRGTTIRMANALASAFHGGLSLSEALIEAGTSPSPIPNVVTVTQTITLPPCNQGPPDPPPFCGGG
jgi:Ca2+-binding RTX toxin-like protein